MLKIIERSGLVIALVVGFPFMLLWIALPLMVGIFIGLPIAAVKFIVTGKNGIDWYMDKVLGWCMDNYPVFLWLESMEGRWEEAK